MKFVIRDAYRLKGPMKTPSPRRILKHQTRSAGRSRDKLVSFGNTYLQPGGAYGYFQPNGSSQYLQP